MNETLIHIALSGGPKSAASKNPQIKPTTAPLTSQNGLRFIPASYHGAMKAPLALDPHPLGGFASKLEVRISKSETL
jgi:hypothetical protein